MQQIKPSLLKTTLILILSSVLIGATLGALHYLLLIKNGQSLNSVFIGLLVFVLLLFIHAAVKGGVHLPVRIILFTASALGYVSHIIAATSIKYITQNLDVQLFTTINDTLEFIGSNIIYHSLSLIYPSIFLLIRQPNFKPHIIHVPPQSEARKRGDSILAIVSVLGMLAIGGAIFAAIGNIDNQIEYRNTLILAALIHITLVFGVNKLTHRSEALMATFSALGSRFNATAGRLFLINVICGFWSLAVFIFLIGANSTLDSSLSEKHQTSISDGFKVTFHKQNDYCYHVKHWQKSYNLGSLRFCNSQYGTLRENEIVEIGVRAGAFGDAWVDRAELMRFRNFKTFLDSLASESDFRHANAQFFYGKDKRDSLMITKIHEWDKRCSQSPDFSCRLRAYFYDLDGDEKMNLELTEKACDAKDITACLGLYISQRTTEFQKEKYLVLLEKGCNGGDMNSCSDLGAKLWEKNYPANYNKLIAIYDSICQSSQEKPACKNLKYLKSHPPRHAKTEVQ